MFELKRRELLRAGAFVAAAGITSPAYALISNAQAKSLTLNNLHTGERLKVDYAINGQYQPEALQAVNHVLRDYRNGEVHVIEPKLLDLLNLLQRRLDSTAEIEVISGYRSPATNAAMHEHSAGVAAHSLHMQGMAIDIRIPGVALDHLHNTALAMQAGGVGYYPSLDFVHVDVGRVRRW